MSFRFNPSNDRVLCVHAPQGIAPGNNWTADVSLKDYKIIWKIRTREMIIILEDFNCTTDKMDRDGENKTRRRYWCCSSYACQNSPWISSLRIYGEGRTQIPLSSLARIGPSARIQDRQGLH